MALGVPIIKGPLGRVFLELRDASLRAAEANVVVGDHMAKILRQRRIAAGRIHAIPNWCDDEEIQPVAPLDNPLRCEWGLADRFVVGYSGNLGRGHEFATVIAAAERLHGDHSLCFLFIDGGQKFAELRAGSGCARTPARPAVSLPTTSGENSIEAFARHCRRSSDFAEARARRPDRAEQILRYRRRRPTDYCRCRGGRRNRGTGPAA
jgi:glycosyltransferase involved in cell wall biosynthesis